MFSVQPKSRPTAPKNSPPHLMQAPRGFSVRVFKNPTLSAFPYTATAKFDVGYRLPTAAPADARQNQNWYGSRDPPSRQPLPISREPSKSGARFGSWTDNRARPDTPRPQSTTTINYADFIYERSVSSKSDLYSETETASTTTFSPSTMFSPTLSGDSTLPSEVPTTATSSATNSPDHERHPFPLQIPALNQLQNANRGMFGDASPTPVPPAPSARSADLPDMTSPPRFLPPDAPTRSSSPTLIPLSESPEPASLIDDFFEAPPPSISESIEAERIALRNAQYNSSGSAYYQAGMPDVSPPQARTSLRTVASSSFVMDGNDALPAGVEVFESSSLATETHTFQQPPLPGRMSPPTAVPLTFVTSGSSSSTVVNSESRRPRLDSFALNAARRNVPVSQLVEIGGSSFPAADARRARDSDVYEELRGLDMLSDRQRETFFNAFAPGTQPPQQQTQSQPRHAFPTMNGGVPAVVRSDSSGGGSRGAPSPETRARRVSGNLWNSLPTLPPRSSPVQAPPRAASTPPVPRIDTSVSMPHFSPPAPAPPPYRQSPPRRESPPAAIPIQQQRSRTPVAGPRILPPPPPEPFRRRSEGDQPLAMPLPPSNGNGKRNSGVFQRQSPPMPMAEPSMPLRSGPAPGSRPLDPERRRSDGYGSVVPSRPTTPAAPPAPPVPPVVIPRNVRWNEVLVCPSPILPSQRRKGWFNRRGDQLWTNDGAYKPSLAGQEYPPDLRDYPDFGAGWMNEEGVRIDMGHRLIPKAPLRSALKQPGGRGPIIRVDQGQSVS